VGRDVDEAVGEADGAAARWEDDTAGEAGRGAGGEPESGEQPSSAATTRVATIKPLRMPRR
jgi:hypothetical protein